MRRLFLMVFDLDPFKIETCPGENPYLVRQIVLKDTYRLSIPSLVGTISGNDALVPLKKGDLVAVDVSFYAHKDKHGKYVQDVCFSNLIKIKEV